MTTAPYAFLNEVVPLCSLYSDNGTVWPHWFDHRTGRDVDLTGQPCDNDRNNASYFRSGSIPD